MTVEVPMLRHAVLTSLLLLMLAPAAAARTVDDFETGPFSHVISDGELIVEDAAPGAWAGTRYIRLLSGVFGGTGTLSVDLATSAADDAIVLDKSGDAFWGATFFYDGVIDDMEGRLPPGEPGLFLLSFDAFAMEIADLASGSVQLEVGVCDVSGCEGSVQFLENGTNLVPLAEFGGRNLGDLRSVYFSFSGFGSATFRVLDFSAVPEPSSFAFLLIAAGFGGLLRRAISARRGWRA